MTYDVEPNRERLKQAAREIACPSATFIEHAEAIAPVVLAAGKTTEDVVTITRGNILCGITADQFKDMATSYRQRTTTACQMP